jgi:hypothetical protein
VSRTPLPPLMSPEDKDALLGGCIMLLFTPAVWVFLEFAVLSIIVSLVVAGFGMHPVVAILAGIATMVGLYVWLRARWAGLALLSILTAVWSAVGAIAGWMFSPKSTKQLEWLHQHRLMSAKDLQDRLQTALRESDPLWDAFFTIVGALLIGGLAYFIHRSVRGTRKSDLESQPAMPFDS